VLPEESVGSTRERLAFIETKVRLFAVGEGGPAEVVPLAASEVLTRPGVDLATGELVLGDRQRWVQVLIDWAESIPGLRAAHRGSYLAWHCDGRLVLKIRRTRGASSRAPVSTTANRPAIRSRRSRWTWPAMPPPSICTG